MAWCSQCGAETELYDSGVPICIRCSNEPASDLPIKSRLIQDLTEATTRFEAAERAYARTLNEIPSGLPHPDGVQRIYNASAALSAVRREETQAHSHLNDYLSRGVVPENLKQG